MVCLKLMKKIKRRNVQDVHINMAPKDMYYMYK